MAESNGNRPRGTLMMIGGAEEKIGDCLILAEVVRRARGGPLVVATAASDEPDYQWDIYSRVFRRFRSATCAGSPHRAAMRLRRSRPWPY